MYRMGRRLGLLLLAGLLVVLTACSSNNSNTAAKGNGDSEGKATTLKFFHRWPNEPRNSYFNYIKEEFEKQNPGVKIEMESVLNDNYKEKIKVLVSSGDIPDVFSSWSDSFAESLVSSGRVEDLTAMFDSDKDWAGTLVQNQLKSFTFDDKIYGVPFTMDGKVFFYNKKIFNKLGLEKPKTWDEFIALLDKLKAAGYDTPIIEGLQDSWAVGHYLGTMNQRMLSPEVLATDYAVGTGKFTDPGYLQVLKYWQKLATYMGPNATSVNHEATRNMFIAGEVPIHYLQFAELGYLKDKPDLEFDYFNFPQFSEGKGNAEGLTGAPEGFMISKETANKELAEKFVKFIVSPENAAKFQKDVGSMTTVIGAATEENSPPGTLGAIEVIQNAAETTPWLDNAVDASVADAFMRGGQAIAADIETPEDVLKEVQAAAAKLQAVKK